MLVMRFLHEALFGPGLLRFVNVDEKPFWFNALHGKKVLAHRGQREVRINEAAGKRHERWSGFTVCASWAWEEDTRPMPDCWQREGKVPPRGCLFKAETGEQMREQLVHDPRTYVDTSPSGSYRVKNILGFYD